MKVVLRNYLASLRKHMPVTLLNLLGLSAAFVAFTLILMQVSFEYGYDQFRPAADRIYRVETKTDSDHAHFGGYFTGISRSNAEALIRSSPHIEAAGMLSERFDPVKLTCEDRNGNRSGFDYPLAACSPELPSVIQLEMKEGSQRLDDPSQVLIPQSVARNMFGRQSALGQRIQVSSESPGGTQSREVYVSGVYKDIPANSVIRNALFVHQGNSQNGGALYVRLASARQKTDVEEAFNQVDLAYPGHDKSRSHIRLQALTEVYFADYPLSADVSGNKRITDLFLSIGLLILAIAMINYFNFAMAISPQRIRSINMQKILGSKLTALRGGMMLESVLFCLSAYCIALLGLYTIEEFSLIHYLQAEMTLAGSLGALLWGGAIAAAVGALAGLYPAFYSTAVPAALSLKGSFGLSFRGRRLRTVLVGFQYVISIALLISAVFMNLQYRMMRNQDLGFNTDQVLMVRMSPALSAQHGAFADLMARHPGVQQVAFSASPIVEEIPFSFRLLQDKNGEQFELNWREVSANYLSLMNFRLVEGRDFTPTDQQVAYGRGSLLPVVINRKAREVLEVEVGDIFEDAYQVVGVIEDFNFKPFHAGITPFMFEAVNDNNPNAYGYRVAHLKINTTNYRSLIGDITRSAQSIDPDYEGEPVFLNRHIDTLYQNDAENIARVTFFSVLAIIISLAGVFSLISFEARFKRKEVGVRRVFGASVPEILALFNRTYIRVVVVCFVLAAPMAWYAMQQWLQSYTIKIPLYWWIFALVFLAVGLLTSLTVTFLSYRTATDNPVTALQVE